MSEYIKREDAKEKLAPFITDPEAIDFWEWQCSEIDEIPAADVKPVVRGEWIEDDYAYNRCSECGYEFDLPEEKTPFCPNCGADMRDTNEKEEI